MALAAYNYLITDEAGNVVTGASIEVRRELDNALVSLYADRDGTSSLANPFTDATGSGRFHTAGGAYKVTATKGAFSRSFRYVAIGLAGESDFQVATFFGDWASTTTYPLGSYVMRNGVGIFISKIDANLNHAPVTSPAPASDAYWSYYPGLVGPAGVVGNWRGPWVTATAYAYHDVVSQGGSSYIATVAHTSGTFATDLAAGKWQLVASKGDTGAGVTSVTAAANNGLSVNNTDPNNPVLSGVNFTGDSGSGGVRGMVPAPAAGDAAANKYLKADGLWTAVAAGGGKVRIVDFPGGIYTPAAGTKAIYGILTGGGAGGGSAAHATSAVGYTSASGGTGGNTIIFSLDEADLFSGGTAKQFEVIVGAGGAGAPLPTSTASVAGTVGGDSTFTNYTGSTVNMRLLAKGGVGGSRGTTNVRAAPPDAGASTITVNSGFTSLKTVGLVGGSGNVSRGINVNTAVNFGATISAEGGSSYWGPGAIEDASQAAATAAVSVNGKAAIFPGAGGGGGAIRKNGSTTTVYAAAGGAGATGKCLILEFY